MESTEQKIQIEKDLLHVITHDPSETAAVAGLVYVSSNDPGFTRVRNGENFYYMDGKKILHDNNHLNRIKRLVLPPAWENVWICKLENGHLQATGLDKLYRKQYRYHHDWIEIRNQNKFSKLLEFGTKLPMIREKLAKDLSLQGYPQNKVLAAMVSLLAQVNIRVGNVFYERLYGSFGLTTLKDHHIKINGTTLKLMFRGKKGVYHDINLRSRKLARIIQGCKDIPGKELFQYYDDTGARKSVDSGMVNAYIREISGSDFTAKDFRTWAGTVRALLAFGEVGNFETSTEMNKKIAAALDMVASHLGNTRAVCKKYYVHPVIINLYQEKELDFYLKKLQNTGQETDTYGFQPEEKIVMQILEDNLTK
jgi:DNA topoisomerase-1